MSIYFFADEKQCGIATIMYSQATPNILLAKLMLIQYMCGCLALGMTIVMTDTFSWYECVCVSVCLSVVCKAT